MVLGNISTIYPLVLLSSLTAILAATIPPAPSLSNPPVQSIAQNDTASIGGGDSLHCEAGVPFSPFYLTLHKCAAAIQELNNSQDIGLFHHGFPNDAWSLPVTEYANYCKVTVDMGRIGSTDESSWLSVKLAATQLNILCWGRYQYRYRGGWLTEGKQKKIVIKLEYRNQYSQESETLTIDTD